MGAIDLDEIGRACAPFGLVPRGGFHPTAVDGVPPLGDGRPCATLVLVGNVDGSIWPTFANSPEKKDGRPDALDRWTRRILGGIGERLGADTLFPFGGPPYLPFQRWAQAAEAVKPSAIGILIHPEYGLWHAYRGALAFAASLDLPVPAPQPRPCDSCAAKPCLTACPVGAFTIRGYDADSCRGHVGGPAGTACLEGGCLARLACPVGRERAYSQPQMKFHMAAFLSST
jgi:ferredoxin